MITELHEWLNEAFKEAQVQSMSEVEREKWYYERKANAFNEMLHVADVGWELKSSEELRVQVV